MVTADPGGAGCRYDVDPAGDVPREILRHATKAIRYAKRPSARTTWNPYIMDRSVARTAPTTEENPFTAQPHATYSRGASLMAETARTPNGMNMPRHIPSGASSPNAMGTRATIGSPNSPSVRG